MTVRPWVVCYDLDAFFMACESLVSPELTSVPAVVCRDAPRAVVATANYPARKFGIGSAMPLSQAKRRCGDLLVVEPHGRMYRAVSRDVRDVLVEQLGQIHASSIDEGYALLPAMSTDQAQQLLQATRAAVSDRVGVAVSIGAGPTTVTAKMLSELAKPNGLMLATTEDLPELLGPLPVRAVPGVGPRSADRLQQAKILTCFDLVDAHAAGRLSGILGFEHAPQLVERLTGHATAELPGPASRKSMSAETTFEQDAPAPHRIEREVWEALVQKLVRRCRRESVGAHQVSVKVKFDDFSTRTAQLTVKGPLGSTEQVLAAVDQLVRKLPVRPVRLAGVTLRSLLPVLPIAFDECDAHLDEPTVAELLEGVCWEHPRRGTLTVRAIDGQEASVQDVQGRWFRVLWGSVGDLRSRLPQ